jgi:HEPN superfamily RES-like protein/RES domain-containing protein
MCKQICGNCIEEEYLESYINDNGKLGVCSYCDGNESKIIPLDIIVEIIVDGIRFEYDQPENGLGWIDGEWVDATNPVMDSFDILSDEIRIGGSKAFSDILSYIDDLQWCEKDFYGYSDSEELKYTWEYFKKQVKHRTRFVFLIDKIGLEPQIQYTEPSDILKILTNYLESNEFVISLPKGKEIYRGRFSKKWIKYNTIEELGPPEETKAFYPNRFSPSGIPMFYGAEDRETCFAEVGNDTGVFTIAKWKVKKDLTIIDFTKIFKYSLRNNTHYYPDYPSVFDEQKRNLRTSFSFLINFANDLSKVVKKDGREHIEYVPTQIVSEYLRRVYKHKNKKIDGICFYSSINGKKNYVFFADINNCKKDPFFNKEYYPSRI